MAKFPKRVLDACPLLTGLKLRNRGKVRDTYDLDYKFGPNNQTLMLTVVTNRVSIYDFGLGFLVPFKGEVLNAVNIFWKLKLMEAGFGTDLVAYGSKIDEFLPAHLRGNKELQKVATVVLKAPEAPQKEDIVRFILTGTGWDHYQSDKRVVCGHVLPPGLINGSMLPWPIYTPTNKATDSHDEHITADSVAEKYGYHCERQVLQMAQFIRQYAYECGLIFGDTKFELYQDMILDEVGTPDSSRYFLRSAYEKMMYGVIGDKRKLPPSLDKQYVRNEGTKYGLSMKLDPTDEKNIKFAWEFLLSEEGMRYTSQVYRYILWKLSQKKLELFQQQVMGISGLETPKKRIEILVGSKNDMPQLEHGLGWLTRGRPDVQFRVSVMSCHRNQAELIDFAINELVDADVVIAAAGKAAQLPADIKVKLCLAGRPDIPVIGVALKGATLEDDRDATGSIKGLPGQPVELREDGEAHFGSDGFFDACVSAANDEFLPKPIEAKPAEIGQWIG